MKAHLREGQRTLRRAARREQRRLVYPEPTSFSADLLRHVWGLEVGADVYEIEPYLKLYNRIRKDIKSQGKIEISIDDIKKTLNLLKLSLGGSQVTHQPQGSSQPLFATTELSDIERALRTANLECLQRATNGYKECELVRSLVALWLFMPIRIDSSTAQLGNLIAEHLPSGKSTSSLRVDYPRLSWDFCEKNLTRKGGFQLIYTSDLSEHLAFTGTTRIQVFQHISALEKYAAGPENALYPKNFLRETIQTLNLLFRPTDVDSSIRTRRIARKRHVNIELAMEEAKDDDSCLDLSNYPYWGERLAKIQQRYDATKPKTPKQWWFDRRSRFEWATFWTAIVVFVLTVVFGIISSVTGILQVVATFQN